MLGFSFAFILIMIVILVVIETVTVRFIYENELIIRIDFLLFLLILYPSRNKKRRRKRKFFAGIRKRYFVASATKRALEYLFARSSVVVHEVNIASQIDAPAKLALFSWRANYLTSIIVTLLSLKTKNVTFSDTAFNDDKNPSLDVSLSSTLFNLLSSLVIFSINAYGNKRKRGRKKWLNQRWVI